MYRKLCFQLSTPWGEVDGGVEVPFLLEITLNIQISIGKTCMEPHPLVFQKCLVLGIQWNV